MQALHIVQIRHLVMGFFVREWRNTYTTRVNCGDNSKKGS